MNSRQQPLNQLAESLGRLACFFGLPHETLKHLAQGAHPFSIARGEILFAKGDPSLALHVVVSGQIRKYLPQAGDLDKTVALVDAGDCLDAAEVYLGLPHPASAVAKSQTYLISIDRDVFMRQVCQSPGLACHLLENVSRRVMSLMHDVESCTPRSSLQRVSCFLLRQRPPGLDERFEIVLANSKRELASTLNIAQETLSRVFQHLSSEGVIEVQGRYIQVLDSRKLLAINTIGCPPVEAIPD